MTDLRQLLTDTRTLIHTETTWTQHQYARIDKTDLIDDDLAPLDDRASCWCIIGGLIHTAHQHGHVTNDQRRIAPVNLVADTPILKQAVQTLAETAGWTPDDDDNPHDALTTYNDFHTHRLIIELLDFAIERQP